MAFADLLINICTVERNTPVGAPDDYGHPVANWGDHLVNEPCRLMAGSGRELTIGAEVVIADYKLFLGNVNITEQDRVVMGGVTYEILLVMDRQDGVGSHHKECFLRAVR